MRFLKQSTAIEVKVGPFVDSTDGFTAETALTITQAEVLLAKEAGDWAQKNETTSLVHESNGWYRCLLDATDTGTVGTLMLQIAESGALPVWAEFTVLAANVYDSLIAGSDALQVHANEMTAGLITAAVIATGAIDADAIAADAITAAKVADGTIDANTFAAGAITAGAIAADAIGASELAADAAGEIADAVWDELKAGHTVADSFGDYLDDEITSRAAPGAEMDLVAGAVDAAAIATDAIDADAIAASAVTEIQAGLATSTQVDDAEGDLNDIQTRLPAALVGGRMDSSVGAMAASVVTAAAIATDAIDGDAVAASAVTEIQSGLATAAGVSAVETDTQDIQSRLPAALVGGRMAANAEVVGDKTGYALTSAERDSIANALLDLAAGVETGITPRQAFRAMAAILGGLVTGGAGLPAFQSIGGSTVRVTITADSSGNRSSVVLNL